MMWRMVLPRHQLTSACTIARRVMDVSTGSSMLTRTAAGTAAGGGESALATVMRRAGTAATRAAPGAGMQSLRAGTERERRRLRGQCWLLVVRLCVHVMSEISLCSWAQLKNGTEAGGGQRGESAADRVRVLAMHRAPVPRACSCSCEHIRADWGAMQRTAPGDGSVRTIRGWDVRTRWRSR